MIIRSEGVTLMMIQPVAVRRDTGHENIADQASVERLCRCLDLSRGGAALPIVDIVKDDLEPVTEHRRPERFRIVSIRYDLANLLSEFVAGLAMDNRDLMTRFDQSGYEIAADEQGTADNEYAHAFTGRLTWPSLLIVILESEVSDKTLAPHPAEGVLQLH